MIRELTPEPYAVLPLAIADAAFIAFDDPVFLTRGASTLEGLAITIELVRVGRDEVVVFVLSCGAGEYAGGRLVGWLDVGFTTRSLGWALAGLLKHTTASAEHTDTKRTFLKFIKNKLRFY